MKQIIFILTISLATATNAQITSTRKAFNGTEPGFLSFAEKMKLVPASSPLSKMKMSGNSFFLSASKIKHDAASYMKFNYPAYVWPDQVCFDVYTKTLSSLQFQFESEKAKGCLVEMNLWFMSNGSTTSFNVRTADADQVINIDSKGSAFITRKLVIPLFLKKGSNVITVYCKSSFWSMLNSHITFME